MDGTDRDVMAGQQLRQGALIQHVALLRRDMGQGRDLLGVTGDGGDAVAAAGQLSNDARAGISGGAHNCDFHDGVLCDGVYGIHW
jgi:hypothetical protein